MFISLTARGKIASGGALSIVKHFSDPRGRLAPDKFILLMIGKGEPRYAITKYLPGIFVLSDRAKVEYPIILAVTVVKKAFGSFSWITVN